MALRSALLTSIAASWGSRLERLRASPTGYRLAHGAAWTLVGTVISRGLGLVASIVVARLLGRHGFGELGVLQSTVGLFGLFAGLGVGITATRHVAAYRRADPGRAGRIIALSFAFAGCASAIVSVVLVFASPWIAASLLAAPGLAEELRIASLLVLLGIVNGAQTGALAGFEAFRKIAWVNLVSGLLNFPLLTIGTYAWGLPGAVWGLAAGLFATAALSAAALRREMRHARVTYGFSGCLAERAVLWRFSLPAFFSGAMVSPVYWACSALLVNLPGGYEQMGIFSAANQWFGAIPMVPGFLGQASLPVLSESAATGSPQRYLRVFLATIKLNALVVTPVGLALALLSPWIMASYGPGFAADWPTLVCCCLAAMVAGILWPIGQVVAASSRMWTGFGMNALWGVAFLLGAWLYRYQGAVGIAAARLVAYVLQAGIGAWFVRREIFRGTGPAP